MDWFNKKAGAKKPVFQLRIEGKDEYDYNFEFDSKEKARQALKKVIAADGWVEVDVDLWINTKNITLTDLSVYSGGDELSEEAIEDA